MIRNCWSSQFWFRTGGCFVESWQKIKLLSFAVHTTTVRVFASFFFWLLFLLNPSSFLLSFSHHFTAIFHFCCARCTSKSNCSLFQFCFFPIYCFHNLPSTEPTSTSSRPVRMEHDTFYLNPHIKLLDFKDETLTLPYAIFLPSGKDGES